MKLVKLTVECIGCKKRREIDYEESHRLSMQGDVPMCPDCGMPAIAILAEARKSAGATRKR